MTDIASVKIFAGSTVCPGSPAKTQSASLGCVGTAITTAPVQSPTLAPAAVSNAPVTNMPTLNPSANFNYNRFMENRCYLGLPTPMPTAIPTPVPATVAPSLSLAPSTIAPTYAASMIYLNLFNDATCQTIKAIRGMQVGVCINDPTLPIIQAPTRAIKITYKTGNVLIVIIERMLTCYRVVQLRRLDALWPIC